MFKLYYYQKSNGDMPVKEFISSLPGNVRGKLFRWIGILQEKGYALHRPFADKIRDNIYELRLSFGHLEPRILYFFMERNIILTHGFLKKSKDIPVEQIEKAVNYMNDFIKRNGGK